MHCPDQFNIIKLLTDQVVCTEHLVLFKK